jgi:hypothetical protein
MAAGALPLAFKRWRVEDPDVVDRSSWPERLEEEERARLAYQRSERLFDQAGLELCAEVSGSRARSVEPLANMVQGEVSVAGQAMARETLRAPLSGLDCVGYRLVGMICREEHRRKLIDLTVACDFEVEQGGQRILVDSRSVEILGWPPLREERPFWRVSAAARRLILRERPQLAARGIKTKWLSWSEWRLSAGDAVRVVGTAREAVTAEGLGDPYRGLARRWMVEAGPDRPALILVGREDEITAGFLRSPLELPRRFFPPEVDPAVELILGGR